MRCPICAVHSIRHSVIVERNYIDGVILNYTETPQGPVPQFKPGQRFWDEDDREHAHQTQRLVTVFACSEGHMIRQIGKVTPCPVDGCHHHDDMTMLLNYQMHDMQGVAATRNRLLPEFDATLHVS